MPDKPHLGSVGERINANTIAIVSGNLNATYLSIAYDLSAVLDDGDEFRVLPVIGKGGGQNIRDVRFLKGVDLGITQSILLNRSAAATRSAPIDDKIVYIAKLFNEEMHLIVRADRGIDVDRAARRQEGQLQRHRQRHAAVHARYLRAPQDQGRGSEHGPGRRVREAEEGRDRRHHPDRRQAGGRDGASCKAADGFRILPVPFAKALQDDYLPATLTNEDYPGLIAPGEQRRDGRGRARC